MRSLLLVVALVACGSVNKALPDAGGGGGDDDASTDGGTGNDGSTTTRGTVHVQVIDRSGNGAPAVGVPVVFVDPDGSVVATVTSDSNGKAQADVLPGASVTTVTTLSTQIGMRTVLGVQPGDNLVVGPVVTSSAASSTFAVSWPALTGASTYFVYGPCGFQGFTNAPTAQMTMTITAGCVPAATMEVLVQARDAGGATIGFNDKAAVTFAPGGSVAMNATWASAISFQATIANIANSFQLTTARKITDGEGFNTSVTTSATGTQTLVLAASPVGGSGRMQTDVFGNNGGTQTIRQHVPGNGTTYSLDLATALLPWMDRPTFDVPAQTFTVTHNGAGTSNAVGDLLGVSTIWQRGNTFYTWDVFGPDTATIKLPVLPADAGADLNPTATDQQSISAVSYKSDALLGYDAVRERIGDTITNTYMSPRSAAAKVVIDSASSPDD